MVDSEGSDRSDIARSFPPIFQADAKVLILGSMPGRASLRAGQYYAHPQNAFWPIIEDLLGLSNSIDYAERTRVLIKNRIALWDVLRHCERPGSLDSSIKACSVVTNDFPEFFESAANIRAVFFNGATAEKEYTKRVIPNLTKKFQQLVHLRLPSTSPAMAGITRQQKLERWRAVVEILKSAA